MITLSISVGTHETPNALMLALEAAGITIDPIARGLWKENRIHQPPRSLNLEAGTAKELGLDNQRYRSVLTAFTTWQTILCPAETIAQLALQQSEWISGKRIIIVMEPLRFPEMMNDGYAYVFNLQDGKISVVNIHADDSIPEDAFLITMKQA